MASYTTHKLLQSLCRSPDLTRRMQIDPASLCREFHIGGEEAAAICSLDPGSLARIGVHPILQVHLMIATNAEFRERMNLSAFADKLR